MSKVFMVKYCGFNPEIPIYTIYSNYESAKNFILNEYRKEWPNLLHNEDFLEFHIYKSPEKAREEFKENNGEIPCFARVIPLDVND